MLWLNLLFIIIAVFLTGSILLQSSAAGLGSAFGGGGADGFYVRRGSEKRLFQASVVLSILFFAVALAHLFVE